MIEIIGKLLYLEDYIMEKYTYDVKNSLWYENQRDYFIPCLTLLTEKKMSLSAFGGQRHLCYIKHHKRVFYTNLLTSCKLNGYLADIGEQARKIFFRLVGQMAECEGVTEQLKATD